MRTQQLQQNNPILYIFIGKNSEKICCMIRDVQQKKLDLLGIAYITVNESSTEQALVSLLKNAHNDLMQKQYLYAGELRVNYILDAHDELSLSLLELKEKMERFLSFLYPVSIVTDVYAIIDDKQAALSGQTQVTADLIKMLETASESMAMVYLMSNVSKNTHNDEMLNIVHSIALIARIKDYVSLKPESNIHNYYNEDYFKKDAFKNSGRFVSIGYSSIKKPSEVIKGTLLTKLLNYMENREFHIDIELPEKKIVQPAKAINALVKENLLGIAVNPKQNIKNTTNIQALDLLFNNRLNLYYELNFSIEMKNDQQAHQLTFFLEKLANRKEAGFFAVYNFTSREGKIQLVLHQLKEESKAQLEQMKKEYSQWSNEKIRTNINEDQCFDLARKYLEWKWDVTKAEVMVDYYEHLEQLVDDYHKKLKQMKKHIDFLSDDNKKRISVLESALPFMNHAIGSFYEDLLVQYLDNHNEEYAALYGSMYSYLKADEFDKYVVLLNDYIENTILCAEMFNKPITEEATDILCYNRISEDMVYSYIFEWIINNKHLNVFLKTGEKHLYSEINVLLDANSKLTSKVLPNKEHMNFFYDNNENEIHILYHTGGFAKEELYYWELYVGGNYEAD